MGLLSPFKSLFNKDEEGRESQLNKIEDEKKGTNSQSVSSKTNENVSAATDAGVSVQKQMKSKENLQIIKEKQLLWEMNKKLDELMEIKDLYDDMLDWMVKLSKKGDAEKTREESRGTSKESSLSPRLRQVLEIVREKGEVNASDVSKELGLSKNRCSELLNALFKGDYLSKNRVGRKVYYRVNSTGSEIGP